MDIEYVSFNGRGGRARYLVQRFRPLLRGSVLDVGCDTRRLHELIPDVKYVGVDIGGDPDIEVDLERCERLPFDDRCFDCVVCTDVLEHLDNLHAMFNELIRVSRGAVIISLPNCWYSLRVPLFRGRGTVRYYGLPVEPPEDRHKWFFNVDDLQQFVSHQARRQGLTIGEQVANVHDKLSARLRRLLCLSRRQYLNRYAHSVWTVLRVAEDAD